VWLILAVEKASVDVTVGWRLTEILWGITPKTGFIFYFKKYFLKELHHSTTI
jgi:hypothetical protein